MDNVKAACVEAPDFGGRIPPSAARRDDKALALLAGVSVQLSQRLMSLVARLAVALLQSWLV